jgi:methanogen homoisocitrate dehydrogenase
MPNYKICVIPGDGIGPEVISSTTKVLKSISEDFDLVYGEAGYNCYKNRGTPLPEETVQLCLDSDAVLFGAVTTPPGISDYFSPIVRLRKVLNLYANVRPYYSLPLNVSRKGIDLTVIRENTEDLYIGKERKVEGGAVAERLITKEGSLNILKYAFDLAVKKGKQRVTVVHKANVLRLTDGLFLETARDLAKKYPQIIMEELIVDACAMKLIMQPEKFEILVTTNMFGDILSDEAAALIGGLGLASSANIGFQNALFEPVHGSAPDIAGQNKANPSAALLTLCLLLEYLGETEKSEKLKKAVLKMFEDNKLTTDLGGSMTTNQFTEGVIARI